MATTLSALKASGARVWWKCQECRASDDLDLDRVIAAKGPDYDLTDRTAACPTPGCGYWVGFYARQGMRNTPLRTEKGMLRQMDRRTAWLKSRWSAEGRSVRAPSPDPTAACPDAPRTDR